MKATRWDSVAGWLLGGLALLPWWQGLGDRVQLWGLWHLERASLLATWWAGSDGSRQAMRVAWGGAPGTPALPALVAAGWDDPLVRFRVLVWVSALGWVAVVAGLWSLVRAQGGRAPALLAVLLLACAPWAGAQAQLVGSGTWLSACSVWTAALIQWGHGTRQARWHALAVLPLAASLWMGGLAWLLLPLWFVLLMVDWQPAGPGQVALRSQTWASLLLLPAAVALAVALHPLWRGGPGAVGSMVEHWLKAGAEPSLWLGARHGAVRPGWGAAAGWVLASVPTVALPGVAMLLLGQPAAGSAAGRRHSLGWWGCLLGASVLLIWSLRSPWHATVDLRAWAAPWVAGAAGLGWWRLLAATRQVWGPGEGPLRWRMPLVVAVVVAAAVAPLRQAMHRPQAWHPVWLGGVHQAAVRGMWRAPHAPVPAALLREVARRTGGEGVCLPVNGWEWQPALRFWQQVGEVPDTLQWAPPGSCRWVLLVHDDGLGEFAAAWQRVQATGGRPERVWWAVRGSVPWVTLWRLP
jgi:hypothetical protein